MNNKDLGIPEYVCNQEKWLRARTELKTEDETLIKARYIQMAGALKEVATFQEVVETVSFEAVSDEVVEEPEAVVEEAPKQPTDEDRVEVLKEAAKESELKPVKKAKK